MELCLVIAVCGYIRIFYCKRDFLMRNIYDIYVRCDAHYDAHYGCIADAYII